MGNTCCTPGTEDAEINGMGTGVAVAGRQDMSKSPNSRPATSAPAAPKAKAAPAPARAQLAGGGGGALDFHTVITDLDKAEMLAYGTAFTSFGAGAESGSVPMDCQPMRDFVATNSACAYDDLDVEILKRLNDDEMKITLAGFVAILRENAVADSKVLERFISLSSNGETIDSQECRSGLLMFKDELGPDSVGEGRWEQVFDAVMNDAGAVVGMEAWMAYCKKVARIARVVHLTKA